MAEACRIIRTKQVLQKTGISRSTLYRLEKSGTFPKKRQISPGTVGYIEAEVDEYISSCAQA